MIMLLNIASALLIAWLTTKLYSIVYNLFFSPLASFPGPKTVSTGRFKAYQELYLGRNWIDVLRELHAVYGDVVRVGPNELHFSSPSAYHEIYNNTNRWDKEPSLYHSFGEDRSSFGFLTYREAKQRKDVLAPLFSKRAIADLQGLVKEKISRLCQALERDYGRGDGEGGRRSSDMLFALRCFTLDTIMGYCFAKDVESTEAEDFQAPTVVAMDASLPGFVLFRHFDLIRRMVFSMPGWLTKLTNPALAGLVDLQELLGAQVNEVVQNPASLQTTSHPTIYHRLMDPEINKAAGVPSPGSLYEEAQALFFGGAESAANTAMIGIFHILRNPAIHARLLSELQTVWKDEPDLTCPSPTCNSTITELEVIDNINPNAGSFHCKSCTTPLISTEPASFIPSIDRLERLPYLTAIIKESLRLSPSVPAPLPRIVPSTSGTTPTVISNRTIPPGTIVGMSHLFVHSSPEIFSSPETFNPERWLQKESGDDSGKSAAAALEKWLVAFSRGPRSCLGQNLGMCELYFAFAVLFWKLDMELDGTTEEDLRYRECFLPAFQGRHMRAFCRPVVR
ncbi:Putative cytochrome P450 [Septoria linicola]|uniref:Cytochrome P450 n=1 Tax=Septoria linicola TaxID=215465 RepID=A0A9Q9AUL8_9PEZI|nr:Putative cytochrome P450 [Septoria linicola]